MSAQPSTAVDVGLPVVSPTYACYMGEIQEIIERSGGVSRRVRIFDATVAFIEGAVLSGESLPIEGFEVARQCLSIILGREQIVRVLLFEQEACSFPLGVESIGCHLCQFDLCASVEESRLYVIRSG